MEGFLFAVNDNLVFYFSKHFGNEASFVVLSTYFQWNGTMRLTLFQWQTRVQRGRAVQQSKEIFIRVAVPKGSRGLRVKPFASRWVGVKPLANLCRVKQLAVIAVVVFAKWRVNCWLSSSSTQSQHIYNLPFLLVGQLGPVPIRYHMCDPKPLLVASVASGFPITMQWLRRG